MTTTTTVHARPSTAFDVPVQQLLTASRVKSYSSCPRRHHFAYTLGVRSVRRAAPLVFGTAMHDAIEQYWRTRASGADELVDADGHAVLWPDVERRLGDSYEDLGDESYVKARALLELYCARWNQTPVEVLAVERSFQLPLVHPASRRPHPYWRLAGKIDLIVRLEDGRTALVEHKTTSSDPGAGTTYRTRLAMDPQPSIYFQGSAVLGMPADLCIYDVLVKPGVKRAMATPVESRKYKKDGALYANQRETDESIEEFDARIRAEVHGDPASYLVRFEVPRPDAEHAEIARDLWTIAREILATEEFGYARRNSAACHEYSGCEYLPVCMREASITDSHQYRRVGPSPELDTTKKAA